MPFISPWRKVICPFCFGGFHLADAPSRKISANVKKEPDPVLGRFLGVQVVPVTFPVVPAPDGLTNFLHRFYIPTQRDRNAVVYHRICPYCHMELPIAMSNGYLKSDIIAIVGTRSSGKSNYFGVLLELLIKRYADEVGFAMMSLESYSLLQLERVSSDKLRKLRYGSLFDSDRRKAVPQTVRAELNPEIRIPLIYRLSSRRRKSFWNFFHRSRVIDLVIFDAAGEDVEEDVSFELFGRYVNHASGILFLIDPFSYSAFRNRLPDELRQRISEQQRMLAGVKADPTDAIEAALRTMQQLQGHRPDKKHSIPAAVVLTKIDMLKGLVDPLITNDVLHDGGYNEEQCSAISDEIRDLLKDLQAGQLESIMNTHFENYAFFGVSALGSLPAKDFSIGQIRPINVGNPLFWILYRLGFLDPVEE